MLKTIEQRLKLALFLNNKQVFNESKNGNA